HLRQDSLFHQVRLALKPFWSARPCCDITEAHATLLAAAIADDAHKDAVLGQRDRMRLHLAEDRAATDVEDGKCTELFGCAERDGIGAYGVENRVADVDIAGVLAHLIAIHLNGAENAVFDAQAVRRSIEFEARVSGPLRLAVAIHAPAGHEC